MPRLTSISEKLITTGGKRSPVFVKNYTGTDFSAVHSTWTFSTGTISLRSNGLPYHVYGNNINTATIVTVQTNKTWPLRAGTNQGPNTSTRIVSTYNTLTQTTSTSTVIGNFPTAVSTNSTIGYWLNGVAMYNASAGNEAPVGFLSFNNLNYNAAYDENLYYSFNLEQDNAGAHWMSDGIYHYHNFSFSYAWLNGAGLPNNYTVPRSTTAPISPKLNDLWYDTAVSTLKYWTGAVWTSVPAGEASRILYLSGALTHADGHSKILAWSLDGYPVYGPYGYNQPLDQNSGVRAMVSGYTIYDKVRFIPGRVSDGVTDTSAYPLGIFVQDYYYAGTGDLDASNGRFCVTPEYPQGTYAYFTTINTSTGRSTYPYTIGEYYKSTPASAVTTATDNTNGGGFAPKQTS